MGRLIYSSITSLDGYIADADGEFDWSAPDAEVHAFVNDQERPIGTYLYGRRLYEIMTYWETATAAADPDMEAVELDYAGIWRAAEKVVYSTTLEDVRTARTRLERSFDPAAVRTLVDASESDVGLGGATLSAHAIRAGIVDEYHQYINPIIVGGGTPQFPLGVRVDLRLLEHRRFGNGVIFARYAVR
jgi:dihydrofolate reductase